MPFGLMSGVGRGMGVLHGGPHLAREGEVLGVFLPHWFEWRDWQVHIVGCAVGCSLLYMIGSLLLLFLPFYSSYLLLNNTDECSTAT